jgi:anoctamin-8
MYRYYCAIGHVLVRKLLFRTQEQHDIHVTVKLVMFEFVNTFLALFYVGFYMQDLKALRHAVLNSLL